MHPSPLAKQISPLIQRQVEEEEEEEIVQEDKRIHPKKAEDSIQRQENEEKDEEEEEQKASLQIKQHSGQTSIATSSIESHLNSLDTGGEPLSKSAQTFFEPRFGYNFSQVRIHKGTRATESTRHLHAQAFTAGRNIVFNSGRYSPETPSGKRLLAHELVHIVQQGSGSAKASGNQPRVTLQRRVEEFTFFGMKVKRVVSPVNWGIDREKGLLFVLPKTGTTLDEVARFLYGNPEAAAELAAVNNLSSTGTLIPNRPLRLTGKKPTKAAYDNLNASPKVPLGVDPEAFLTKKKNLDRQLEKDFDFIVDKLDEAHYSDSDEGQVISILRKWGQEKFTTNVKLYPNGGEYLDNLFSKLMRKSKDVGVLTTQWTNYYSLIFNHFDRVSEVKAIRDTYSRRYKRDSGLKEMSFGSFFWNEVKEGKVRDQIFAYFKGLGKGFWSGAKGTVMMLYTLVTDPKKFWSDLKKLPSALKTLWEKRSELWNKFTNASPEEQAEMIGKLFGEIEFMIASAAGGKAAAKGIEKLTKVPGVVGKIARTVQVVTKLPQTALGAVAKGIKTVVLSGGRIAVQGAIFAAKGIYRVGKKIFRGTWSVVEKTVDKITRKLYYFYDDVAGKLREIPARFARQCVKCKSPCKLTKQAVLVTEDTVDDVLAAFKRYSKNRAIRERVKRVLSNGNIDPALLKEVMEATRGKGAKRILRYIERMSERNIANMDLVLKDLAQGGGKLQGAEWVLRYIDRRRPALWDKITKFEAFEEAGSLGGRVYDAVIGGVRYQFKSWREFYPSTFLSQIKKDLAKTSMRKLKWVFEARELGTKRQIIKKMEQTLRNAVKTGNITDKAVERIIRNLDKIVEVRKLLKR